VLTLPNALTLSRLPMAAAVWLAPRELAVLVALMAGAAITDVLDGRFARAIRARRLARGEDAGTLADKGGVGAWLDPLCDKTFVVSLLLAVWIDLGPAWWVVPAIATRELFLIPMALVYRLIGSVRAKLSFDFRAGWTGKLATVSQFAAVVAILVAPRAVAPLAIAAAVIGFAAFVHYAVRARRSYRAAFGKPGG
jgi:cardiolipin synthase